MNIKTAKQRHARSRKAAAVGRQNHSLPAQAAFQQAINLIPGWIGHLEVPDIRVRAEFMMLVAGIIGGTLAAYHLMPALIYSEWFALLMHPIGYSAFLLVYAATYGIWWAMRTDVPLRFAALHSIMLPASMTVVFEITAGQGGLVGSTLTHWLMQNRLHPTIIATVGTLTALWSSTYLGNPMVKLIQLAEHLVNPLYVSDEYEEQPKATKPEQPSTNASHKQQCERMEALLKIRKIKARVTGLIDGLRMVTFEVQIPLDFDMKQITKQTDDLKLRLGVESLSIAPSGKPGVLHLSIPKPDDQAEALPLSKVLQSKDFHNAKGKLILPMGMDINKKLVFRDLAKAPHLLVAGTTGGGKSVVVNGYIVSLMTRHTPASLQFLMIDPKMLELSIYETSPFLSRPVVTNMDKAAQLLQTAVDEMEYRYALMSLAGVRNLEGYNSKAKSANIINTVTPAAYGDDLISKHSSKLKPLPHIVIIVDEFADLMMTHGEAVEKLIARLGQKARAAGIHLILATQRPDKDVVTGIIKANIPSRAALMVSDGTNSRIILDQNGAEELSGAGDMLFRFANDRQTIRVQAPLIEENEIETLIASQQPTKQAA